MGKSKNISIRFDEEKTAFVFEEEKIEKHQRLVDFLLDKYWWEKKIGNNPVTERNYENRIEDLAKGNGIDMGNLDPRLEKTNLRFTKSSHKKAKKEVLKSAITYAKTTPASYDAAKNTRLLTDEYGQTGKISTETWKFTNPDPNYPKRKEGEGYIDFQLRCHEYTENKNKPTE